MSKQLVHASTAGVVSRLEAAQGDAVKAGDTVMVLEVMKMEFPMEASVSGRLTELYLTVGDVVEEGQVLFAIEP